MKEKLETGKCFLLLDALDEVPKERRNKLADRFKTFARKSNCPIIATSRIVGYGGAIVTDAKEVEIVPFRQKQIRAYIERWFDNAKAADALDDDTVSVDGLLRELRNKPQIRGLTQNPLLLSLLCSLYQTKKLTLPVRRCEVYKQAVNAMFDWRNTERDVQDDSRIDFKIEILEGLAYRFSCENREKFTLRDIRHKIADITGQSPFSDDVNELTAELTEKDGILQHLDAKKTEYIFLHRTFQEYLTARYMKEQPDCIELAREHFWDFDWHETLTLLAGLMDAPIPLLEAIMGTKDDIFSSMLLLAGRCVAESQDYKHPTIKKIFDEVYLLWRRFPELEFIQSVVVTLGRVDGEWVAKGLDDLKADSLDTVVEVWEQIGSNRAIDELVKVLFDEKHWAVMKVVSALGQIGSDRIVVPLIDAICDETGAVKLSAAMILGRIGSETAIAPLTAALADESDWVRARAAEALGWIGDEIAVKSIINALADESYRVRGRLAEALGRIGSETAVSRLIKALNDPVNSVRGCAAKALGQIGSEMAVLPLIEAFDNDFDSVRVEVAVALGRIGSETAVHRLIEALDDPINLVRGYAAEALGQIGSEMAVLPLIEVFGDESESVIGRVVAALQQIATLHTNVLVEIVKDSTLLESVAIFQLARRLAIRHRKAHADFLPVYPEIIERYRAKSHG
ncbi:HEAT repeat domain-containing protein [Candidatus Poribacteria bacterium]|nr:HEAT repeat domain-containing protein [Candidatus Poribacteria bacterium]